jgi:hypothetical protein
MKWCGNITKNRLLVTGYYLLVAGYKLQVTF